MTRDSTLCKSNFKKDCVRYITTPVILANFAAASKKENVGAKDGPPSVEKIKTLSLRYKHRSHGKFYKIEGLSSMSSLEDLDLGGNMIKCIEGFESLHNLLRLNLSGNQISSITGIFHLQLLQALDLSENYIKRIPSSFEKLKNLTVFRIDDNKLSCLNDLNSLATLPKLLSFSWTSNQISTLPQARNFAIMRLFRLEMLDGEAVTQQDRALAQDQFRDMNLSNLATALQIDQNVVLNSDIIVENVSSKSNNTTAKIFTDITRGSKFLSVLESDRHENSRLKAELKAKEALLNRQVEQLAHSNAALSELEQRVAFQEIDVLNENDSYETNTLNITDQDTLKMSGTKISSVESSVATVSTECRGNDENNNFEDPITHQDINNFEDPVTHQDINNFEDPVTDQDINQDINEIPFDFEDIDESSDEEDDILTTDLNEITQNVSRAESRVPGLLRIEFQISSLHANHGSIPMHKHEDEHESFLSQVEEAPQQLERFRCEILEKLLKSSAAKAAMESHTENINSLQTMEDVGTIEHRHYMKEFRLNYIKDIEQQIMFLENAMRTYTEQCVSIESNIDKVKINLFRSLQSCTKIKKSVVHKIKCQWDILEKRYINRTSQLTALISRATIREVDSNFKRQQQNAKSGYAVKTAAFFANVAVRDISILINSLDNEANSSIDEDKCINSINSLDNEANSSIDENTCINSESDMMKITVDTTEDIANFVDDISPQILSLRQAREQRIAAERALRQSITMQMFDQEVIEQSCTNTHNNCINDSNAIHKNISSSSNESHVQRELQRNEMQDYRKSTRSIACTASTQTITNNSYVHRAGVGALISSLKQKLHLSNLALAAKNSMLVEERRQSASIIQSTVEELKQANDEIKLLHSLLRAQKQRASAEKVFLMEPIERERARVVAENAKLEMSFQSVEQALAESKEREMKLIEENASISKAKEVDMCKLSGIYRKETQELNMRNKKMKNDVTAAHREVSSTKSRLRSLQRKCNENNDVMERLNSNIKSLQQKYDTSILLSRKKLESAVAHVTDEAKFSQTEVSLITQKLHNVEEAYELYEVNAINKEHKMMSKKDNEKNEAVANIKSRMEFAQRSSEESLQKCENKCRIEILKQLTEEKEKFSKVHSSYEEELSRVVNSNKEEISSISEAFTEKYSLSTIEFEDRLSESSQLLKNNEIIAKNTLKHKTKQLLETHRLALKEEKIRAEAALAKSLQDMDLKLSSKLKESLESSSLKYENRNMEQKLLFSEKMEELRLMKIKNVELESKLSEIQKNTNHKPQSNLENTLPVSSLDGTQNLYSSNFHELQRQRHRIEEIRVHLRTKTIECDQRKNECEELKREIQNASDLSATNTLEFEKELEIRRARASNQKKKLEAIIKSHQAEIAMFRSKNIILQDSVTEAEASRVVSEGKCTSLVAELARQRKRIDVFLTQIGSYKSECHSNEMKLRELQDVVDDTKVVLTEKESKINVLQQDINRLRVRHEQQQLKIANDLRKDSKFVKMQLQGEMKDLAVHNADVDRLRREFELQKSVNVELSECQLKDKESIRLHVDRIKELQNKLQIADHEQTLAKSRLEELRNLARTAQSRLAITITEKESEETEVRHLQSTIATLNKKLKDFNKERQEIESSHKSEISRLNEEISKIKQNLCVENDTKFEDRIESLHKKITELENYSTCIKTRAERRESELCHVHVQEIEHLKESHESEVKRMLLDASKQRESALNELASVQKNALAKAMQDFEEKSAASHNKTLRIELDRAVKDAKHWQSEYKRLTDQYKNNEVKCKELEASLVLKKKDLEQLRISVSQHRMYPKENYDAQIASLEKIHIDFVENLRKQHEGELCSLRESIHKLESQYFQHEEQQFIALQEAQTASVTVQHNADAAQSNATDLEQKIRVMELQYSESTEHHLGELEEARVKLTQKLETVQNNADVVQKRYEISQSRTAALEKKMKAMESQYDECAEHHLLVLQEARDISAGKLATTKRSVEVAQNQVLLLEGELEKQKIQYSESSEHQLKAIQDLILCEKKQKDEVHHQEISTLKLRHEHELASLASKNALKIDEKIVEFQIHYNQVTSSLKQKNASDRELNYSNQTKLVKKLNKVKEEYVESAILAATAELIAKHETELSKAKLDMESKKNEYVALRIKELKAKHDTELAEVAIAVKTLKEKKEEFITAMAQKLSAKHEAELCEVSFAVKAMEVKHNAEIVRVKEEAVKFCEIEQKKFTEMRQKDQDAFASQLARLTETAEDAVSKLAQKHEEELAVIQEHASKMKNEFVKKKTAELELTLERERSAHKTHILNAVKESKDHHEAILRHHLVKASIKNDDIDIKEVPVQANVSTKKLQTIDLSHNSENPSYTVKYRKNITPNKQSLVGITFDHHDNIFKKINDLKDKTIQQTQLRLTGTKTLPNGDILFG